MTTSKPLTIRLHDKDNVVVARVNLSAGTEISEETITCMDQIPFGHKIATSAIKAGDAVKKYGQIIGFASDDIKPGEHVHLHNLELKAFDRDYAIGADAKDTIPEAEPCSFEGIVRSDGRIATRNYLGIISTVNCSASVSRFIADAFRGDALTGFPHIDGIVPMCHGVGCGCSNADEAFELLLHTLAGYIRHPNFAGVLVIGLGCEVMQIETLLQHANLQQSPILQTMTIQDTGGTKKTVQKGIDLVRQMLPEANRVERQPVSVSHLILALECGGSDAY
ncbi:MAG: UxaA family hydrolase, partial [Candidatus Thorarchaeota archaeon]